MKEMINKIQATINTLQALEIKATYENMNHLMGALQLLADVRDDISKMAENEKAENADDHSGAEEITDSEE
jgi:hypothetical protein